MNQRILQHTAASLRVEYIDADGELADPADTSSVTVAVTTAAGVEVVAAGTSATHGTTGVFTVDVTAGDTAELDQFLAVWTFADGTTRATVHDICGGVWFTATYAREVERTQLADQAKYTDALIRSTRLEVEDEAEFICDRAFVPRFKRVTANGTGNGTLVLPVGDIRSIRSMRTYPYAGATSYSTLGAAALGQIVFAAGTALVPGDPMIRRSDGGWFDEGWGNVVLEVEYGLDSPPADLRRAAIARLRTRLHAEASAVPDRATSFSVANGGSYNLASAGPYKTGIPDIDGVYARYSRRTIGTDKKATPASRPMRMNVSRDSLFHR